MFVFFLLGATTEYQVQYQTTANSTTGAFTFRKDVAFDAMAAVTTTVTANVDLLCIIEGTVVTTGTSGTVAARARSETANTDLTVRNSSWGFYF